MLRPPPRPTRTDTLFPYTTLFRSLPPPPGSVVPVPDSATLACAWSGSFELMASVPEKLPAAVGAKRSWTWQLAPGDRVPQSCPMTLKGAAGAPTCHTNSGALPAVSPGAPQLPLQPNTGNGT